MGLQCAEQTSLEHLLPEFGCPILPSKSLAKTLPHAPASYKASLSLASNVRTASGFGRLLETMRSAWIRLGTT